MSSVYIYTVKDRETGAELFTGQEGACAKFLDCAENYVRTLAMRESPPSKTRFGHVLVERRKEDRMLRCVDCGAEMPGAGPMRKRCPECEKRRGRERSRQYRAIRKDAGPMAVAASQAKMQDPCRGCIYLRGENSINRSCEYILMVGHSRGCPPGAGCTVKKTRK